MSGAAGLAAAKRRRSNAVRNMNGGQFEPEEEEEESEVIAPHTLLLRHDRHIDHLNRGMGDMYNTLTNLYMDTEKNTALIACENNINTLTQSLRSYASGYEQQRKEVEQLKQMINKMVNQIAELSTNRVTAEGVGL